MVTAGLLRYGGRFLAPSHRDAVVPGRCRLVWIAVRATAPSTYARLVRITRPGFPAAAPPIRLATPSPARTTVARPCDISGGCCRNPSSRPEWAPLPIARFVPPTGRPRRCAATPPNPSRATFRYSDGCGTNAPTAASTIRSPIDVLHRSTSRTLRSAPRRRTGGPGPRRPASCVHAPDVQMFISRAAFQAPAIPFQIREKMPRFGSSGGTGRGSRPDRMRSGLTSRRSSAWSDAPWEWSHARAGWSSGVPREW